MTRITKKQLPHHYAASRVLRSRKGLVTFSILVAVSLIGFFTHTKNDVSSTNSGESEEDIGGDFEQIIPRIGEVMPLSWKADRNLVTPNAYRVSLPPELLRAMKEYCDTNGLTELARHYILSEENNISPGGEEYLTLKDGLLWYAQRPAKKWKSDMHWISPANEETHEAYLKLINENGFLSVLNYIGDKLGLDSLVAYHLTFIVVSHCERGFLHHDTTGTDGKVFNVIIPMEMVDGSPPELIITKFDDDHVKGRLKYQTNVAVLIGDDARHATSECDYRDEPGAMRLAATVYIADINEDNAESIASGTLTQAFPLPDVDWLLSQRARHWERDIMRTDIGENGVRKHFVGDRGRRGYDPYDNEHMDCANRVAGNPSKCEIDWDTRSQCPVTCGVYLDSSHWL